jgi:Haem-containing dehydratase
MIGCTHLPQRRSAPPVHRPEGFAPSYDSFEPRFGPGNDHVMFALFGVENRGGDASCVIARLTATFSGPDAPEVLEHGRIRADYGPHAKVWFAYWRTQSDYNKWLSRDDVIALWSDDTLLEGPIGIWREAGVISHDYNETSFSRTDALTGLVHLSDGVAITDIHGYWGSARDRLVAAVSDPLDPVTAEEPVLDGTLGRRVRVQAPGNACFIRTSQDIASATDDQCAVYANDVEPSLLAGVRFLRENGAESGCIGIRFVEECDADGAFLGRTCGTGFFDSLGSLERWTHTHATHDAIMESFLGMVNRFQGNPGLQLWHEVTVFPAGSLVADYVNCTSDGSLMHVRTA